MFTEEHIKAKLCSAFNEKQSTVLAEIITATSSDLVRTDDSNELKSIVKDLGVAQQRTEKRVEELALAQQRTEKRVEELALAQQRTEKWVEELALAQQRTEKRVEELALAQQKTEDTLTRFMKQTDQRFKEMTQAQQRTEDALNRFARHFDMKLGAMGARWGMQSEASFREAAKYILEDTGFQVERYEGYDDEGTVFGRPSNIELDLIIKNGKILIAEIKSSLSKADVAAFERKVEFYKRKVAEYEFIEKMIISPFIDPRGTKELANVLEIRLVTDPENV